MKVKINRNVTADGRNHLKGSTIELDDKDAKSLISRGFAEVVKEPKAKADKADAKADNK
ncbi:MAG: hypothetical protein GY793_04440 [Proteobacteria bacterium]|nr:hypothetical protein [Pseudomonadota bacterium]